MMSRAVADPSNASRRRREVRKPSHGPRLGLILVGGALPTIALVALLLSGEDGWRRVRDVFPADSGDRALRAGVAFFVLAALAWGALPVSFHSRRWVKVARIWFATRPVALRVLLLPAEGLTLLLTPVISSLYVIVAVAVIVAFLASLLFFLWILWPDLLGGYEAFHQAGVDVLTGLGLR